MTRNLLQRLPWRARLRVFVMIAAAAGCDSSSGTVPPHDLSRTSRAPPRATLGDERVTAECRTASVSVRARRHFPDSGRRACPTDVWIIDLSVESDAGEAMLLDFLRPYELYDWEVHAGGGRVRHDLSVIWHPLDGTFTGRASLQGVRPMTMRVCPEGDRGPVLACSDVACELYDREDQVPEAFAASLDVTVRSPWGYEDVQDLHEGDTLDIPMTYTAHRDRAPGEFLSFGLAGWEIDRGHPQESFLAANQLEFVSPSRYEFGSLRAGESGTVVFRLRAKLNDIEEPPVVFPVIPVFSGCAPPPILRVRVLDRP